MLNSIIWYFSTLTMEITVVYIFKILTNHKEKIHWKYLVLSLIFSGISTINYNLNLISLHSTTNMIFHFILYFLIFQKQAKETIFYGMVIFIIGSVIDFLAMVGAQFFPFLSLNVVRSLYTIFMELILICIFKIKKLQLITNSLYEKIRKIKFPYIETISLIVLFLTMSFSIYFIIVEKNIEKVQSWFYIFTILVLIVIYLYLNREFNNYALKETNNYLIKNNEFYMNLVNDYRILKHNIIHQLSGIKSVSNQKSIKLINDLIKQYNESSQNVHYIKKMPVGINGIVYEKIYNFNNKKINLEIDNHIESNIFENLTPRRYNLLCESLGILLDNALQASEKTQEKIMMIDMRETKKSYNIKIINTFEEFLDIDKLGAIKYSTKKTGHGIGLFSIIGRKKIKIKTSIINDLFINEVIVDKKTN